MDRFLEISGKLKKQIEEILEKARADQLSFEMLEIYQKVIMTLENSGIKYLHSQKLFPFKDFVLAWDRVLKEVGMEENSDILLGIILEKIYEEESKKNNRGGKRWPG